MSPSNNSASRDAYLSTMERLRARIAANSAPEERPPGSDGPSASLRERPTAGERVRQALPGEPRAEWMCWELFYSEPSADGTDS